MTTGPDPIVAALADQQAELSDLLTGLTDEAWTLPSRCEGWTIADVVLHVAQSDELAIASLRGEFADAVADAVGQVGPGANVDDVAAVGVERERGAPSADVYARWQTRADELVGLLEMGDLGRRVQWVAGEVTARTLATTRLAETWIHAGDVADAVGVALAATDRLWHIARLAWRTLPYAFARAGRDLGGPVALRLVGPSGESWDFDPDTPPLTTITGDAIDWCGVAARRADPATTTLRGEGPDAHAVLELVRTYA